MVVVHGWVAWWGGAWCGVAWWCSAWLMGLRLYTAAVSAVRYHAHESRQPSRECESRDARAASGEPSPAVSGFSRIALATGDK